MKRGEITIKVLETLQGMAEAGINILDVACSASRGSAYRKASIIHSSQRESHVNDWAHNYRQRTNLYNLLNHLHRDGLVEKRKSGKISLWKLTRAGRVKLVKLKNRKEGNLYSSCEQDGKLRLVIFDIIEQERTKRDWIRKCLANLGYKLLQKSVWQGDCPLPEEFIRDIQQKGIINNIHIFEINKKGTLELAKFWL